MSTVSGEATAVTWSGVVTVEGYSETKGVLGVGNSFNSAVFAVGGHVWHIEYYPDGYTLTNLDWIGFGLRLVRPDADADEEEVEAEFTFSMLDHAGAPVPACTAASGVCSFSGRDPSRVFGRFVERTELEASPWLRDDSFSVRCHVTIHNANGDAAAVAVPVVPAMAAELEDPEEDVTMVIGVDKKMEEHMSTLVALSSLVGLDEIYSLSGVEDVDVDC